MRGGTDKRRVSTIVVGACGHWPRGTGLALAREKGGKSLLDSPTAVRIHIRILRDRIERESESHACMPPICNLAHRASALVCGRDSFVSEYQYGPKTMSNQRHAVQRKARARGLRRGLGSGSDSDDSESEHDHESSKEYSYGPRSTRDDTQSV